MQGSGTKPAIPSEHELPSHPERSAELVGPKSGMQACHGKGNMQMLLLVAHPAGRHRSEHLAALGHDMLIQQPAQNSTKPVRVLMLSAAKRFQVLNNPLLIYYIEPPKV